MERRKLLCFHTSPNPPIGLIPSEQWEVFPAANVDDAENLAKKHHFCVGLAFIDSQINSSSLLNLLSISQPIEWIAILPNSLWHKSDVCQLISHCFHDYHTLPIDSQRLQLTLGHAFGMGTLKRKFHVRMNYPEQDEIIGSSPEMMRLRAKIQTISSVDAPVIINGETGTGKELIARAIHNRSARADKPFIPVNCGCLSPTLVQSELFGYERGAFTGATARKIGYIEAANGGTLFLDEIGDLSFEMQVQLLRFIQEKKICRVGNTHEIPVDTRIICATHVNLEQAMSEGKFREDLYYRLNVLRVTIPPLRTRCEDIRLLANYFFDHFRNEKGIRVTGISTEAMNTMVAYSWPGNVRELINRLRQAMIMSEGKLITSKDLGLEPRKVSQDFLDSRIVSLEETKIEAEKKAIESALRLTGKNASKAAQGLGISRTTLYRLVQKYHLSPE